MSNDPRNVPPASPLVTVVMPTFEQASFIRRALDSVRKQTFEAWELVIVDDGSRDATPSIIAAEASVDPRITVITLPENAGMPSAINAALDASTAPLIAYLPSDDVWHRDHLESLVACLEERPDAVLAYSGVRHHYNRTSPTTPPDEPVQPVQVLHRRTDHRWLERRELVTDDFERMFWSRLAARGGFVGTGRITAEWVDHADQWHKVVREPIGGINPYRQRYRVREPMRYHTTVGNRIDEVGRYQPFRDRPPTPPAADPMRILLVGELSYNSDRILALEEAGHQLFGLWTRDPAWYTAVGPVPFGHITDLPHDGWREAVRDLWPDVIYGLLNWHTVPFAREVLDATRDIAPFVWHFKEGPFICLDRGTWPDLVRLTEGSDGRIYSSAEMQAWFETVVPGVRGAPALVIDGDLPKRDWFEGIPFTPRRSGSDGAFHTVVPGRPIGLHPENVAALAAEGIHLHFYGDFTHGQWKAWIERANGLAPGYLHLHANVDQEDWVREFSQYDAGWLHWFQSANRGDLHNATWDDLNLPARIATLAAAGLPVLQGDNSGHIVAAQSTARDLDIGLFFENEADLGAQLRDNARMAGIRANVERSRPIFTFDHHTPALLEFLRAARRT